MISMPASNHAGRAFWSLVALVVLTGAGLVALLAWQMPLLVQSAWLACLDALSSVHASLPALGLALPVILLGVGVARGTWSLLVQLRETRRLVVQLTVQRIATPSDLAAMAAELRIAPCLVLVDDPAPYAFTEGLVRPRIWLSMGLVELLDPAELRAVLCHEQHHLRRRDPLRVLLARCLAQGLFFVPLAASLRDAYLLAKEIDADAVSGADEALAAALLKLLRSGSALPDGANLAAIGPVNATAARVQHLLAGSRDRPVAVGYRAPLWISVALVVALVGTAYVSTSQAAAPLAGGECDYYVPQQMLDETPRPLSSVSQNKLNPGAGFTPVNLPLR